MAAKQQQTARARVSQWDIAREAGVSRVTVSLVLARKDQASPETRRRVLAAAEKLRYRPNLLVQGMQTGRTGAVGVILPASSQFHSHVARGVHDELVEADCVPILLWAGEGTRARDTELRQIHRLVDRCVDGVIVWPADVSVVDLHFHEIWERNIPLVTVDRETTTHADHVGTDEEVGGRLAAEHLLALGHRRFAFGGFNDRPGPLTSRRKAFQSALKPAGASCQVVYGELPELPGLFRAVLSGPRRPTAIFAGNDSIAARAIRAAYALKMRVPEELSVIGYADLPIAAELTPALTTVRQDAYGMGRLAARMVLDRIVDRVAGRDAKPRKEHSRPELVIRSSTGVVPTDV